MALNAYLKSGAASRESSSEPALLLLPKEGGNCKLDGVMSPGTLLIFSEASTGIPPRPRSLLCKQMKMLIRLLSAEPQP